MSPIQRAAIQFLGVVGVLGILVYGVVIAVRGDLEEQKIEAAREQAEREQKLAQEAVQIDVLNRMAQGDLILVDELIDACIEEVRGPNVFSMIPDRRDPSKIRGTLKGLVQGDVSRMLEYLDIPELDEQQFLSATAKETLERKEKTGDVTLEVALTYEVEGFAGFKAGWGIMTCPLRGGQPDEPEIEELYME